MTTPANPNPPLGDPDNPRGLPTHEIPWQQTGYRDENARLLFLTVVLTSSDDAELILMASIQGYSFSIIRTRWWGIVESDEAFRRSLLERGWIEGAEWFQKLPAKRKLAIVTGEAQTVPTPDSR